MASAKIVLPVASSKPTTMRVLIPPDGGPKHRKAGLEPSSISYIGTIGNVSVSYDTGLGPQGLALASEFLKISTGPYNAIQAVFGIPGGPVQVIIETLLGVNDGHGGASHANCDFTTGGTLSLDATFANQTVNPLDLLVGLFVAELSECFMGPQRKGWDCGASNGEGLSRYCAEQATPPGTMDYFWTGPYWVSAGYPNWIDSTENTDRDHVSIGCAMLYLYYMRWLGFTLPEIAQAGGSTLAANYKTLTGKSSTYDDLRSALSGLTVDSDNPFPLALRSGQLLLYRDRTQNGTGDVNTPSLIGSGGWQHYRHIFADGNGAIYAVNNAGQLLFYRDWTRSGTDDINSPSIIGHNGWDDMKFVFSGGPGIIYAVNSDGNLLFYRDNAQNGTGNVGSPAIIGHGGWDQFNHLFYGGNGILYAVNSAGKLLFYRDHNQNGTGNVSSPSVIGQGGWKKFSQLFSAGGGIIYAVNPQGQLLFYRDYNRDGTGDVNSGAVIGQGGWQEMKFLFSGGGGILYAVPK